MEQKDEQTRLKQTQQDDYFQDVHRQKITDTKDLISECADCYAFKKVKPVQLRVYFLDRGVYKENLDYCLARTYDLMSDLEESSSYSNKNDRQAVSGDFLFQLIKKSEDRSFFDQIEQSLNETLQRINTKKFKPKHFEAWLEYYRDHVSVDHLAEQYSLKSKSSFTNSYGQGGWFSIVKEELLGHVVENALTLSYYPDFTIIAGNSEPDLVNSNIQVEVKARSRREPPNEKMLNQKEVQHLVQTQISREYINRDFATNLLKIGISHKNNHLIHQGEEILDSLKLDLASEGYRRIAVFCSENKNYRTLGQEYFNRSLGFWEESIKSEEEDPNKIFGSPTKDPFYLLRSLRLHKQNQLLSSVINYFPSYIAKCPRRSQPEMWMNFAGLLIGSETKENVAQYIATAKQLSKSFTSEIPMQAKGSHQNLQIALGIATKNETLLDTVLESIEFDSVLSRVSPGEKNPFLMVAEAFFKIGVNNKGMKLLEDEIKDILKTWEKEEETGWEYGESCKFLLQRGAEQIVPIYLNHNRIDLLKQLLPIYKTKTESPKDSPEILKKILLVKLDAMSDNVLNKEITELETELENICNQLSENSNQGGGKKVFEILDKLQMKLIVSSAEANRVQLISIGKKLEELFETFSPCFEQIPKDFHVPPHLQEKHQNRKQFINPNEISRAIKSDNIAKAHELSDQFLGQLTQRIKDLSGGTVPYFFPVFQFIHLCLQNEMPSRAQKAMNILEPFIMAEPASNHSSQKPTSSFMNEFTNKHMRRNNLRKFLQLRILVGSQNNNINPTEIINSLPCDDLQGLYSLGSTFVSVGDIKTAESLLNTSTDDKSDITKIADYNLSYARILRRLGEKEQAKHLLDTTYNAYKSKVEPHIFMQTNFFEEYLYSNDLDKVTTIVKDRLITAPQGMMSYISFSFANILLKDEPPLDLDPQIWKEAKQILKEEIQNFFSTHINIGKDRYNFEQIRKFSDLLHELGLTEELDQLALGVLKGVQGAVERFLDIEVKKKLKLFQLSEDLMGWDGEQLFSRIQMTPITVPAKTDIRDIMEASLEYQNKEKPTEYYYPIFSRMYKWLTKIFCYTLESEYEKACKENNMVFQTCLEKEGMNLNLLDLPSQIHEKMEINDFTNAKRLLETLLSVLSKQRIEFKEALYPIVGFLDSFIIK